MKIVQKLLPYYLFVTQNTHTHLVTSVLISVRICFEATNLLLLRSTPSPSLLLHSITFLSQLIIIRNMDVCLQRVVGREIGVHGPRRY